MTLREEFEKEFNWVDKREQPMFLSIKYINWLECKIKNITSNRDCAKCKSIGCPFYDEKMEFNCCANENLYKKCMNNQHSK